MFKVLVNWLYIALTTACLGTGIAALAENKLHYRFKNADSILAMGLVLATVYAQIWSLFYKVGILANIVLLIPVCAIFFYMAENR